MGTDCKTCPAGYFCLEGTEYPEACSPGTYNPNIGGRDDLSCIACRTGEACTVQGLAEPDQPCSPGYYCPGGNFLPNQTEYACAPGTYNDYANGTKASDCIACIERFACLVSTKPKSRLH